MTPDDFAKRLTVAARGVEEASRRGLEKGGVQVKTAISTEVAGATGGTYALHGTGTRRKSGAPKMKVVDDYRNTSLGAVLILSGTPKRVWSMLDSGVDKHLIGVGAGRSISTNIATRKTVYTKVGKKGNVTQTSKRKRFKIGDDWFTGPFMAGGSPARHTFKHGVAKSHDGLVKTIADGTYRATYKALSGS